jgi:hypothetical protein
MGKQELDILVRIQRLKTEPPTRSEYNGMLESARMDIDARLLADLVRSAKALEAEVGKLAPPPEE